MIKLKDILLEDPDTLYIPKLHIDLSFTDEKTIAFLYYNGKVYHSGYGDAHYEILHDDPDWKIDNTNIKTNREVHKNKIQGRLWPDDKVISFWYAPQPNKMNQFIKDLNIAFKRRKFDIKADLKWHIDVDMYKKDIVGGYYYGEDLITIKDYINRNFLSQNLKSSFDNYDMIIKNKHDN